jgi:hypothetical protein
MLNDTITRLKQEGHWQVITDELDKMKLEIVKDMLEGRVRTIEDLISRNAQLEALDAVKALEHIKIAR